MGGPWKNLSFGWEERLKARIRELEVLAVTHSKAYCVGSVAMPMGMKLLVKRPANGTEAEPWAYDGAIPRRFGHW